MNDAFELLKLNIHAVTFTIFLLGLIFGSFANVVILRLPKGESIVVPSSHCCKCKHKINWFDNIPIISWIFLLGKCRHCSSKISIRYPIIELLTGLVFVGIFLKLGYTWTTLEILIFSFCGIICSVIDLDHFILPDVFTLSGIVIGLLGSLLNPERDVTNAFLGLFMGGGFFWLVAYGYYLLKGEEGIGGGDIKLMAWIGAVFGWQVIPFVILVSSISGSLVGIILMLGSGGKGLKTIIPFGPYLFFSAILSIFIPPEVGFDYFNYFIP